MIKRKRRKDKNMKKKKSRKNRRKEGKTLPFQNSKKTVPHNPHSLLVKLV